MFVEKVTHNMALRLTSQGMKKRLRQHVNPLAIGYQHAHGPLDWASIYADPSLPLLVDVGAGYGRFALKHAKVTLGQNVLGIEIRHPAVERAQACAPAPLFLGRPSLLIV